MTRLPRRIGSIGLTALLAVSAARCVQDFVTAPSARTYRLSVAPGDSQDVAIGESLSPFTGRLTVDGQPASFRLSLEVIEGAGFVSVDSAGRVRATGRGVARLRARALGPQLVEPPIETTLTVRGVVPRIGVSATRTEDTLTSLGDELVLVAAALTKAGDTIPSVPIAWRMVSGSGASLVDAATGRVRAEANGVTAFEAAVDDVTAHRQVRVRQRPAVIAAAPDTVLLVAAGQSRALSAVVLDARQHPVSGALTTWRSLDGSVATVSGAGVVSAVADGAARVLALTPVSGPDSLADTTLVLVRRARLAAVPGSDGQSASVGSPLAAPLAVQLRDSAGAPVAVAGLGVWFVAVTPGATFGGADSILAVTDSQGVARATPTLSTSAGANVLVARGVGLAGAAVTFGASGAPAAAQTLALVSGSGQNGTVGGALAAPLVVALRDGFGNGVPGGTVVFRVTLGGGSFGGADSLQVVTDSLGRAEATLTLGTVTGANAAQADAGVGLPVTFSASGAAAAPASVRYAVQPASTTSGSAIAPAIQVVVLDAFGNRVMGASSSIQLAIASGTGAPGAALGGVTVVAAQAGVATFGGVTLDRSGAGYRLVASAAGLASDTSVVFSVASGSADRLSFSVEPSRTAAGGAVAPAVTVTITDALGNLATSASNLVTLELGTTPFGGGGLFGTLQVNAAGGTAVFSDVRIARAAAGYRLVARSGALVAATSAAFDVIPDGPAQIAKVSGDNQNDVPGATLAAPLVVAVRDTFDNLVAGDTVVFRVSSGGGTFGAADSAIALTNGQGRAAATLTLGAASGTNVVEARSRRLADSVVTFMASATPAGLKLAFVGQPSASTGGTPISPSVQVAVQDGGGATQPGASTIVTLSITSGTGAAGASLGGTVSVAAVNGVATFANLSVDKAGTGYLLTATASGVTPATSAAFDVGVGPASRLGITAAPSGGTAGAPFGVVDVRVQDAGGNTVASATPVVTLAIAPGTGTSGANLRGTTMVAAAAGVATFTGLSIDSAGAGYALRASAPGPTGATSPPFTVVAAPASRLAFGVQPSDVTAGVAMAPAVQVSVRDSLGNAVAAAPTITLSITPGTGTPGAALTGGTASAQAGAATFAAVAVPRAGTGYTLTASAAGLSAAVSGPFAVSPGSPGRLGFVVEPTATAAGDAIAPAVQVGVQDAFGNLVPSAAASVTVEIVSGTGTPGATLGGTRTAATVAGVAAFGTLTIDKAGANYTLRANATGLAVGTSASFSIGTAAPESLVVVSGDNQNGQAGAALAQPFVAAVRDRFGNPVTGQAVAFRVASGGGTLGGADSVSVATNASGQASVALTLGPLEVVNTVQALASGLAGSPRTFTATPVPTGSQLAFTTQPVTTAAGAAIAPSVQVAIQSAGGTTITSATSLVTLAITGGTGTAGAHLRGTRSVNAVNGVATFALSVDSVGSGYTLTATASGLTPATSAAFGVTPAPAARLGFTTMPTNTAFNQPITPSVAIAVQDSLGNTVPAASASVTIGITPGTGTAGAVLGGTTSASTSGGIATFGSLSVDRDGTAYSLTASASGLGAVTSSTFNVFGGPSRLSFTVEPGQTTAGATLAPAVKVTILDALGNPVSSATNPVVLAVRPGSGKAGAHLSGTVTVPAVGGVATFADLALDSAATGYQLIASAAGLTPDTSAAFPVVPGAAARLDIIVEPTSRTAGSAITPAVQVAVRDAAGNLVTGTATSVTMALLPGSGAAGATLSGTTMLASVGGVATFPDLRIDKAAVGYRLTASASGPASDTSTGFSITVGPLASVVITQGTAALASLGAGGTFAAEGRDASGNVLPGLTIAWSTTDGAIATVSPAGLVTAVANGTAGIVASANGIADTVSVTVAQVTASVVVTPAGPVTLTAFGQTQGVSAQAFDANGFGIAGTTFAWSSTAPGVATVGPVAGAATTATAVGNGAAGIIAAVDGRADTLALTVGQVTASVVVTPGSGAIGALGSTRLFAAEARDANGFAIAGKTFSWQSDATGVATVSPGGGSASTTATATGNGTAHVIATVDAVPGSATLTVAQVPASVVLTPSGPPSLASFDATQQFAVVVRDSNANVITAPPVQFSSLNTSIATVDATGLATAKGNGTTSIIATAGAAADTSSLTVQQVVTTVVVTPNPQTVPIGASRTFTGEARDANGFAVAGIVFNWSATGIAISVTAGPGVSTSASRCGIVIVCGGSSTITATSVGGGAGGANVAGTATAN